MTPTPDLNLIADMLAQLIWRTNGENPLYPFAVKSIEEQVELCRAALEEDARHVRTATYAAANPLGGPATMFEVMASRIRAGEAMDSVLEDYGLARANGWRPIESAPRDGTEIWAFNGEQGRVRWISGADYELWAWADEVLSDVDPDPEQPTHWRPLPPPPTQEGDGND